MTSLAVAGAIGLVAMQAGIDAPRKTYTTCLKTAFDEAMAKKVDAADYVAFASTACSAQAAGLREGLIAFDVKNGIKRAQASSDAQAQVDDYLATSGENYEARAPKKDPVRNAGSTSTAKPSVTPPPTAAAAPKN